MYQSVGCKRANDIRFVWQENYVFDSLEVLSCFEDYSEKCFPLV